MLQGRGRPSLVVLAADKPDPRYGEGDIDLGPKRASRSFQDMKKAQESYAEEPRQKQGGGEAAPRAEKTVPVTHEGDIDMGPKGASRSFQDMKNAQESYSEEPRQKGGEAGPASEKDDPENAPESGTLREEGPYPFEHEPTGATSSEEEEASEYAAPESGDLRDSARTPKHSRPA
ncbi:hypothetical protein ABPG75_012749 [Micractinium tetrahymenae]